MLQTARTLTKLMAIHNMEEINRTSIFIEYFDHAVETAHVEDGNTHITLNDGKEFTVLGLADTIYADHKRYSTMTD